jgi:hypothetical protein
MSFVRRDKPDARPSHNPLPQQSERVRGIGVPLLMCNYATRARGV